MPLLALVPRWLWAALGAVALAWSIWHWHGVQVRAAYANGAAVQKAADTAAFNTAADEAARLQHALVEATSARQSTISSETQHALAARNADLARSYADLRMRWATYRAAAGVSGQGGATAVSGSPAGTAETACTGYVAIEAAIAPSEAADQSAAQLNGWIDWYEAQRTAWPKP